MTSTLTKWSDEKGNSKDQEQKSCDGNQEEINILNQNFLASIQNELKNCPDACLAPLVMDYLEFLYPLIINPNSKVKEPGKDTTDFLEIAKYFRDVREQLSNGEERPKLSGNFNGSSVGSDNQKAPNAPTSSETEKKETSQGTSAAGPGFFGLPRAKDEGGGDTKDKKITFGSSVSETPSTKPPSAFPASSSTSSFKNFSFGIPSATSTASASGSLDQPFGSTLSKPSVSTATTSSSMFSFGAISSAPKLVTPASSTTAFSSSNTGITTSLFGGGLSGSGFGQSGFGAGLGSSGSGFDASKGNVNGTIEGNKDDSDDDSPPKPDFVPVVESDSLYTQRIKVYEMQGKAYKDLGIGNLFIKELPGPKYQLVIRADNSLGTILVNVVLNASILLKQNKPINILATVPNSDGKPTTYLIRVKEDSVGNELFSLLEKYKNS